MPPNSVCTVDFGVSLRLFFWPDGATLISSLTLFRLEPLAVHLREVVEGVAAVLDEAGLLRPLLGLGEVAAVPADLRPGLAHVGVHVVALLGRLQEIHPVWFIRDTFIRDSY